MRTQDPGPPTSHGAHGDGDDADESAPGWDAIDAVLAAAFPGQEPRHWGVPPRVPPRPQLWGISAYRDGDAWCFVTYGLTELFRKQGTNPEVSGWGYELTMRVRSDAADPPAWARDLVGKIGDWVYASGTSFAVGHRLQPGGPITGGEPPTDLVAVAFAADPVLPAIESPFGRATFLTVVGITADELARMQATSTAAVLADLAVTDARLVTDTSRR